jgi:hypothetical protein
MNKSWFYLSVIGSLTILTTSCGDGKPPTPAASPAAVAKPVAAAPPTVPSTAVAAAPATPTAATVPPTVPAKSVAIKPVSVDVAAGLIPSTEGDIWAKTVSKGRADPFGMLSLQPIEIIDPIDPLTQIVAAKQQSVKIATTNSSLKSGVARSSLSTAKATTSSTKTAKVAGNSKTITGKVSLQEYTLPVATIPRSGVNKAIPKIAVALSPIKSSQPGVTTKIAISKLPTIPSKSSPNLVAKNPIIAKNQIGAKPEKVIEKPLQAMALEISGVIETSGQTQVIIKLPTESFSRYIEIGERIANGKVFIKRIEGQQGLSPTIILEEGGVEVPRKIGDRSSAPAVNPLYQPSPKTL